MALANYSFSYQSPVESPFAPSTIAAPAEVQFHDLLYSPEDHQQSDSARRHKNDPYAPPSQSTSARRSKLRKRAGTPYLPPPNQFTQYPRNEEEQLPPYGSMHTQIYQNPRLSVENQRVHEVNNAYEGTGEYVHDPSGDYDSAGFQRRRLDQPPRSSPPRVPAPAPDYRQNDYFEGQFDSTESTRFEGTVKQTVNFNYQSNIPDSLPPQSPPVNPYAPQGRPPSGFQLHAPSPSAFQGSKQPSGGFQVPNQPPDGFQQQSPPSSYPPKVSSKVSNKGVAPAEPTPLKPPVFTKVDGSSGGPNTKTQIHAVLDYDDDYYDEIPGNFVNQPVTPIQGPILLKNGTVPVVPLFAYPTVNNGSFYQIPILWSALSVALGYELEGNAIQGIPCVKRNYQLFCPKAGTKYPENKIMEFIEDNKALMRRMYGKFTTSGPPAGGTRRKRAPGVPDPDPQHAGESFFGNLRQRRQASQTPPPLNPNPGNSSNRIDACESKTEIVTPYWALNSARKLRAVVNTMHFEQAIHQEVCSTTSTRRCSGDCGCEQKYKWHRLLAFDPDEDCSGIFMDWFLFPSCCVCRCNP